jgi:two-component system, chemotaxis family, protein-glutamate methylesterase/glutaminase
MDKKIKVMIVDDSLPFRSILSSVLQGNDRIEVVSTAYNGSMAVSRIKENKPDIITLDYEMPDMDGLETLKIIHQKHPEIGIIMLSALTTESASITMQAINSGADDFLLKTYEGKTREENIEIIKKELVDKIIRCFEKKNIRRNFLSQEEDSKKSPSLKASKDAAGAGADLSAFADEWKIATKPVSMCLISFMQSHIGTFIEEMKKLHMKRGIPVIVYVKMPESFLKSFVENLKTKVSLSLKIVEDGDVLLSRVVYFFNGVNKSIALTEEVSKIKVRISPSEKDLTEDEFFKSAGMLHCRTAFFLTAETVFSGGILGLKEMKQKGNLTFLLYTKTYKEDEVKILKDSYSQVATTVLLPFRMADALIAITA